MSKIWLPKPLGRRPRFTRLENHIALQEARARIPDHILELLDTARELRGPFEPRLSLNTWQETLYASIATETALTAAAEAVVFPASTQPGYYGAIPGAYLIPHRTLHLRIAGQLSTAATPGTMLWRLRWGGLAGTALVASGGAGATGTAITMAASQTNAFWRAEFYIVCRADGTAGSLLATGVFESPGIPTTNQTTFPATAPAAVTANTISANDLAFTHTPSLTTASFAGLQFTLSSLN
jgi:hypothetical protein